MSICGLILAAGGSSRLGRPKQLIRRHGKPLLEQAIGNALETQPWKTSKKTAWFKFTIL